MTIQRVDQFNPVYFEPDLDRYLSQVLTDIPWTTSSDNLDVLNIPQNTLIDEPMWEDIDDNHNKKQ